MFLRIGLPATTQRAGTSRVTTAPAATMLPSPMETPGKIRLRAPTKQLEPIRVCR